MSEKTAGLARAREERSLRKRRAVENALADLKDRNETITFKAVAARAGVGRPYLYNHFREVIETARKASRSGGVMVEGVKVPKRTSDESRHVEALLRNKIEKLKKKLDKVQGENVRLNTALEKERGRSEYYRRNQIEAGSD